MADVGKAIRLRRILRKRKQKALIVAFDHALMVGGLPGMSDPALQVKRFTEAGVDGIVLNLGILKHCADSLYSGAPPAVILRLDWTNVWQQNNDRAFSKLVASVEDAMRLGADAVMTYLVLGSGDAEFEANEISKNAAVTRECERLGMPHIIESLARGKNVKDSSDPQWIMAHTRMACELGADLIKTDYTRDAKSMRAVVDNCHTPILVLGGARQSSDEATLATIREIASTPVAGIVFGRSIFQAENMAPLLMEARSLLTNV